jgi:mono/diheme cytochrome c family protein
MRTLLITALVALPSLAAAESPQFREGQRLFAETCSACHGPTGRGGPAYANPIWGQGAQIAKFGTAQGLFEYHQMLMPFDDPSRLSDELKWAVTLYVLANHGAVGSDATLGPQNAGSIRIR